MKAQEGYTAKEAFTFPLFCLVCLTSFIYWGCADRWPVGAIIGTLFFGIIILTYIFKYIRFGRDYLRIDANGITYKEWSKTTSLKWDEIEKSTVCYRQSYMGVLFYRELDIRVLPENKYKANLAVRLSGKYCRNKSVIRAVEQFGSSNIYDNQSSRVQNIYIGRILLLAIVLFVLLVLLSCNNRHDLKGNYKDSIIPAAKIKIEPMKHNYNE